MIVSFIPSEKKHTQERILRNLNKGTGGSMLPIKWWLDNRHLPDNTECTITSGILRGGGDLLKWLIENKYPFLYVDHAYFNSGYSEKYEWMRIVYNGFNCNKITDTDNTKFTKLFDKTFTLGNHKTNGKNILVIPPSDPVKYVYGCYNWLDETINKIKTLTDRPVVVRTKPGEVLLNNQGIEIGRTQHSATQRSLEQDLLDTYCVVAYHSSVAITASMQGIPVVCGENCGAYPVSNKLQDIENLKEFDRMPWLYNLCNNQFDTNEIISGDAYTYLREN